MSNDILTFFTHSKKSRAAFVSACPAQLRAYFDPAALLCRLRCHRR